MEELKLDTYQWQPEAGKFISDRIRRVAEIINDYEHTLFIAPIPDQLRDDEPDKSYALIHEQRDGKIYCVRKLREDEINEGLIEWVFAHDNNKSDVLAAIEAKDAAKQAMELKIQMEAREEEREIGETILKSKLHAFKHNGKVYR